MTIKNVIRWGAPSALLVLAGAAIGTPGDIDVDGTRADDPYGAAVTVQAAKVYDETVRGPISVVANSDQTVPVGGEGVGEFVGGPTLSDPGTVITGQEVRVNLQFLGWDGVQPVRIGGFVAGGNFLSNQVIGGVEPFQIGNLGNTTPADFQTMPGEQYVTVTAISANSIPDAGIDGVASEADYVLANNGSTMVPWAQETFTQFGDNGDASREGNSGGSEIDGVYAFISDPDGSLPTVNGDEELNFVVTGNLENGGNRKNVFIDVTSGGSNTGFGTGTSSSIADYASITFDLAFTPEWYLRYDRFGNTAAHILQMQEINETFSVETIDGPLPADNIIMDDMMNEVLRSDYDNSNTLGVAGGATEGTGIDSSNENDPANDDTGFEFKLNLTELGYDPMTGADGAGGVIVSGFLIEQNAVSNQVLGGLPANTPPLGPGSGIDLDAIPGDQFVVVSDTTTGPLTIDGVRESAYGATEYVNPGNSTNRTSVVTATMADDDPMGSEINNFSGVIAQEGGDYFLYGHIGGSLGNFDRYYVYIDAVPGGQNVLRNDNPNIDDGRSNNYGGFTFDAATEPDFLVVYRLGTDGTTMLPAHFADGAELRDMSGDPAVGGGFGGGEKSSLNIDGVVLDRRGFQSNSDPSVAGANGSELAAMYAYLEERTVSNVTQQYFTLHLTGNLNTDFNKVNIFFDVDPNSGQNTMIWDGDPATGENTPADDADYAGNPSIDFDALQNYGGPYPDFGTEEEGDTIDGMTFDAGFTPEHFLTITNGDFDSDADTANIFANFARFRDPGVDGLFGTADDDPGVGIFLGQTSTGTTGELLGAQGVPGIDWQISIDNSSTAGVPGGALPFGISFVENLLITSANTGIEISIPVDEFTVGGMPWDGETNIKVMAIIGNGGHSFMSNQVLPPVCSGELGDPRRVNFETLDSFDQFAELAFDGAAGEGRYVTVNAANLLTRGDCVEPVGACCMGESCSVTTQSSCEGMGGEFLGAGTDCMDNPCAIVAACCLGGDICQEFTEEQCMLAGGVFQGVDMMGAPISCDSMPCEAPGTLCTADLDGNFMVDLDDFSIFIAQFGNTAGDCAMGCTADLDGVNGVDLDDFSIFIAQFGNTAADCDPSMQP